MALLLLLASGIGLSLYLLQVKKIPRKYHSISFLQIIFHSCVLSIKKASSLNCLSSPIHNISLFENIEVHMLMPILWWQRCWRGSQALVMVLWTVLIFFYRLAAVREAKPQTVEIVKPRLCIIAELSVVQEY